MAFGCDFSFGRPGASALHSAGARFVGRYLNDPGGKGLTKAEYQSYIKTGIAVYFIYEESGRELLGGYSAGQRVAVNAKALLRGLGLSNQAVYFTVDFDASPSQIHTIQAALDGASSVLGFSKVGIYGGVDVINACVGKHCRYGFQTYAWSYGQLSPLAHVYQYLNGQWIGGAQVDYNRNLKPDFGASVPKSATKPVPKPPQRRKPPMDAVICYFRPKGTSTVYAMLFNRSKGEVQKRGITGPQWSAIVAAWKAIGLPVPYARETMTATEAADIPDYTPEGA